jgi:hypothetical protein
MILRNKKIYSPALKKNNIMDSTDSTDSNDSIDPILSNSEQFDTYCEEIYRSNKKKNKIINKNKEDKLCFSEIPVESVFLDIITNNNFYSNVTLGLLFLSLFVACFYFSYYFYYSFYYYPVQMILFYTIYYNAVNISQTK